MSWVPKERKAVKSGSVAVFHVRRASRKGRGIWARVDSDCLIPRMARRMERAKGTTKAGVAARGEERKPAPPRERGSVARACEWGGSGSAWTATR